MDQQSANLELRLLGGLSIATANGSEIILTRKHKLLVTALVLAGARGLSREKLIDLLWLDLGEKQARAALRQALAATRKGLGAHRNCLRSGGNPISIDGSLLKADVWQFERLAASDNAADVRQATELYQGDLLDGIRIKEDGFEIWLRPIRERLRAKAVALLGASLADSENPERCIHFASQLLQLEPTNETAHRALMRSYAAQSRDNMALEQFAKCREVLDQVLAVGPSQETILLFEEIKGKRRRVVPSGPMFAEATPRAKSKPTITVLPFENLSDDPAQNHFAAGMTHDIASALLRHRWLTVVNRTNMVRAGRYAMIEGGEVIESNVDYVVTGSVRSAADRLRIGVQMIVADSGEHIWSENYDRKLGGFFSVQDEIAGTIAGHIDVEVSTSERERVLRNSTQNPDVWDCYHRGMAHFIRGTSGDHTEAMRLFARCVELDPEFGEGHAWWSYTNVYSTFYFDTEPTPALFRRAMVAAKRAVEIDDQNAMFHMRVARVHLAQREYGEARKRSEISMRLNPNHAGIYCGMGDFLSCEGDSKAAIPHFEKAVQLGPRDPKLWAYYGYGALAQLFAEDFEAAVEWSDKAINHPHCLFWAYAHRAVALALLGRRAEAQEAAAALMNRQPKFSRGFAEKKLYFLKRPEQLKLYLDGLQQAGVPG